MNTHVDITKLLRFKKWLKAANHPSISNAFQLAGTYSNRPPIQKKSGASQIESSPSKSWQYTKRNCFKLKNSLNIFHHHHHHLNLTCLGEDFFPESFFATLDPIHIKLGQGASCSNGQLPVLTSVLGSVPWKPSFFHPWDQKRKFDTFVIVILCCDLLISSSSSSSPGGIGQYLWSIEMPSSRSTSWIQYFHQIGGTVAGCILNAGSPLVIHNLE